MPTGRVEKPNTVFLNKRLYPIRGSVTRQPANQFADKTVIGEFTEASDPVLSAITQDDWRGGMGRHVFNLSDPEHTFQFWDGNIKNLFSGHAFPQSDVDGTVFGSWTSSGGSSTTTIRNYPLFHAGYAPTGASSYTLYFATTDNGSSHSIRRHSGTTNVRPVNNPASKPTDMKSGTVGGLHVLAVGQNDRISWTRNDTTDATWFTDSSELIKYVAFWRDMLWGMNASGELFFTGDVSSTAIVWTQVARTPGVLDTGTVTGLYVSETVTSAEGESQLIAARKDGFDVYDNANERFVRKLTLPHSQVAGRDVIDWNGAFYYAYGPSLIKWTPAGDAAVVESVGLDERDGMLSTYGGPVRSLAATPRQLFMSLDASSIQSAVYTRSLTTGWTRFATSSAASSGAKATGKMWIGRAFSAADSVLYLLPGWANGDSAEGYSGYSVRTTGQNFVVAGGEFTNGTLITPWVVAEANQDWTAHKVSADVSLIASSVGTKNSSIFIDYGLNFNDSEWTQVLTDVQDNALASVSKYVALLEGPLPTATEPAGVPFRAFRFRVRWENDDDFGSFDLNRLSLVFEKRPKLRYLFTFDIDLSFNGVGPTGFTAKELRESFDEFLMQPTLGEFAYHADDPGGGNTYWVRAINPISQERTGQIERDIIRCTVMELA